MGWLRNLESGIRDLRSDSFTNSEPARPPPSVGPNPHGDKALGAAPTFAFPPPPFSGTLRSPRPEGHAAGRPGPDGPAGSAPGTSRPDSSRCMDARAERVLLAAGRAAAIHRRSGAFRAPHTDDAGQSDHRPERPG